MKESEICVDALKSWANENVLSLAHETRRREEETETINANMSKRQLNWLSFFKKKEELHDDAKRFRKGSCSGHVDGQNQLQEEVSAATASRVHRQLAKPGQEAGTAAAAGQVHRQPEQEPATVSQVDHQQQRVGTLASASPVQQPEQEASGTATSAGLQREDSEGEESALSVEECGTSSDSSGMGCTTVWTEAQLKVKQTYYPWLFREKSGFGCTTCKAVGTLGAEKTSGMKLAKEWVEYLLLSTAFPFQVLNVSADFLK